MVDAKARESGYQIGTDDRVIADYVNKEFGRLQKKRGVSHVHYLILSSSFSGDSTKSIHEIRRLAPGCKSVCLVTPEAMLRMVEVRLKHSDFTPTEIEDILMKDGRIHPDDINPQQ